MLLTLRRQWWVLFDKIIVNIALMSVSSLAVTHDRKEIVTFQTLLHHDVWRSILRFGDRYTVVGDQRPVAVFGNFERVFGTVSRGQCTHKSIYELIASHSLCQFFVVEHEFEIFSVVNEL